MKKRLRAAALQFNIKVSDSKKNIHRVKEGLTRLGDSGAQLVVLPEMWSCGYDYPHLAQLAEQTPRVLEELCATCRELKLVTVGSLPEADQGHIYNTSYVCDCGEIIAGYRKLHLFSTMKEDRFLAAGDQAVVVDSSVGRLGLAICYDLRFVELFRKLALEGAEVICVPAEWPKPRQLHWDSLLRARAIENQLFIIATNCCGIQGKFDFFGHSQLISPLGHILAAAQEEEAELVADFDFSEMEDYRRRIDTLNDRRPDIYGTP